MISEIFPTAASDQKAEKKEKKMVTQILAPRSIAATGLIHYSEIHIAQLGDLFKERYKIIHRIIS